MKNKILLVVSILAGLMLLNSGLNKLFQYMPMPELTPEQLRLFGAMATITWLMPLVGIAEAIGGALMVIPKTRLIGALINFPVMIGAVIHHLVFDPSTVVAALICLLVIVWIFVENRAKLLQLL